VRRSTGKLQIGSGLSMDLPLRCTLKWYEFFFFFKVSFSFVSPNNYQLNKTNTGLGDMGQGSVCILTFPFYDSMEMGETAKHSHKLLFQLLNKRSKMPKFTGYS